MRGEGVVRIAMSWRAAALPLLAAALCLRAHAQFRFSLEPVPTESGPSPRADHLTIPLQSGNGFLVIVHGGRDAGGAKSDTWTYIVRQNRWRLLAASARAKSEPPPPMWGAVGGYRFVKGMNVPFLYVTLGALDGGGLTNGMWVMELANFTWQKVTLDGDIPAPRYGAVGSLERFVKPDRSVQPSLIISHGRGQDGPLSDTYKCSFDAEDPYRATWRKLREPVGQYETRAPHPLWKQASTFTAARDLVVFGGCYASERHSGVCPSRLSWLLKYEPEKVVGNSSLPTDGSPSGAGDLSFEPDTDSVSWKGIPDGPPPRVGAAMAQGLNSFEGTYDNREAIAVLYSGTQDSTNLPVDHVMSAPSFDGGVVELLSTASRTWRTEVVHYVGPEEQRNETLARRQGSTMSIVRNETFEEEERGITNEFFLLFGGQLEDGNFTNSLIKLGFDALGDSKLADTHGRYTNRPFVHGVLMFVSWGLLMVTGAFNARYVKRANGHSRHFVAHVAIQTAALAVGWAGVGLVIYGRRRTTAAFLHAQLGLGLIAAASVQPIVAVAGVVGQLRTSPLGRGAGEKRPAGLVARACRAYHGAMGLVVLVVGAANMTLGLFLMVAPTLVWVHWVVYSGLVALVAGLLEATGGRRGGGLQTRAESLTRAASVRISRGSSYVGRVVRSLRGESTAQVVRGQSFRPGAASDEIAPAGSTESMFVRAEDDISPSRSADGGDGKDGRKDGLPAGAQAPPPPVRSADVISFQEPGGSAPNSAGIVFRERLDSGASSVFTYRDPDTY